MDRRVGNTDVRVYQSVVAVPNCVNRVRHIVRVGKNLQDRDDIGVVHELSRDYAEKATDVIVEDANL